MTTPMVPVSLGVPDDPRRDGRLACSVGIRHEGPPGTTRAPGMKSPSRKPIHQRAATAQGQTSRRATRKASDCPTTNSDGRRPALRWPHAAPGRIRRRVLADGFRIEKCCHDDVAFRFLAANQAPDFRSITRFRRRHLEALAGLFVEVLASCQQAGMVKLGRVALDGSKVRANASRRKAMSYKRMTEREAKLQAEVDDLLADAEATHAG